MIKETFGLTTANFIKFIVLVVFLFFFIRTVNMMISLIVNKRSKDDLRKLFVATEILIWGTLIVWVFYMVPFGKLKFIAVFVILNCLNLWLWTKIRQGIAGLFFRLAYSFKPKDLFRIEGRNATFIRSNFETFDVSIADSTEKYFYIDALKKRVEKPLIYLLTKERKETADIQEADQLLDILTNNGFLNENTKIKVYLNDNIFEIKILTYKKAEIEDIKQFLYEIF